MRGDPRRLILALALLLLAAPASALECDDTPLIVGTHKGDRLHGSGCYDILSGRRGADRLNGRGGFDILIGGRGPDLIIASDGERDVIRGGLGFDRCIVDELDEIRGCERITIE